MNTDAYLQAIGPELGQLEPLFAGPDGSTPAYRWSASADAAEFVCEARCGAASVTRRAAIPDAEDGRLREVRRKRAVRRLVKQTVYAALRDATGIHPVWGSSTGVRPIHLYLEALREGMTDDEAEQAVIARFDMLPEKAALLRETAEVQRALRPPALDETDVYVGIPFCTTRCAYCTFSSGEIGDGRLVPPYTDALLHEMEAGAALLRDTGLKLRAVYMGGGTPTALDEASFARVTAAMMRLFPGALEYTVEAGRPDTITRRKLEIIRDLGATRISINPQSMVDRTLRLIGRGHTAAQVEEAYALARDVGILHINMDVIAGLPGETAADFAVTMDAARRLRPESLTVHTLALTRSSDLWLQGAALPDGEEAAAMVRMGGDTARELGMQPYYLYRQKAMAGSQENVGYALPGHACLYNVDMMEETTHVLAFGAGAITKRVYPEEGRIGRAPNVRNIRQYIDRVDEMSARKAELFAPAG